MISFKVREEGRSVIHQRLRHEEVQRPWWKMGGRELPLHPGGKQKWQRLNEGENLSPALTKHLRSYKVVLRESVRRNFFNTTLHNNHDDLYSFLKNYLVWLWREVLSLNCIPHGEGLGVFFFMCESLTVWYNTRKTWHINSYTSVTKTWASRVTRQLNSLTFLMLYL